MADPHAFGPFVLDPLKRTLTRDHQPVRLSSKALDLLILLVERQGETVDKQTLLDTVWDGLTVEENTLTRTVSMVRRALGESPETHQYIVTVPSKGYRFVAATLPVDGEDLSIDPPPSGKIRKAALVITVTAAALVAAAVVYWPRAGPATFYTTRRLTNDGQVVKASVSADGKLVAYASGTRGEEALRLFHLDSGAITQLRAAEKLHYLGLTFGPAGRFLYATVNHSGAPLNSLWRIEIRSGVQNKVLDDIDSAITFHPDGSQFAFIRPERATNQLAVMTCDHDGKVKRLTGHPLPEWLDYPAWSPDGKLIACTLVNATRDEVGLVRINPQTGEISPLTSRRWRYVSYNAWPDSKTLVFSAITQGERTYRLWELAVGTGIAKPVSDSLSSIEGASVSKLGGRIVGVEEQLVSSSWMVHQGGSRKQIIVDGSIPTGMTWMPGRRIAYQVSDGNRRSQLWSMNPDGTQKQRILGSTRMSGAAPCPDGSLVFASDRDGTPSVWKTNSDGTDLQRLTTGATWSKPGCSPDAQWVVYSGITDGNWASPWRVPLAGGPPFRISGSRCEYPSISPNGEYVACFWVEDPHATWSDATIAVLPFRGGDPLMQFPTAPTLRPRAGIRWSPDGKSLLYVDLSAGAARIWSQPITGGPATALDVMEASQIDGFDVSDLGEWLVTVGMKRSDVVLIQRGNDS